MKGLRWVWPLALLVAIFLAGCDRNTSAAKSESEDGEAAPLPVTVTPVRAQKVQRTVEMVATLYASEEVVVSSLVEGRLAVIEADLGDRVSAGQILAKIQDAEFRFAVEQAEASLKETLAKLGLDKLPPPNFDVAKTSQAIKTHAALNDARAHLGRMKALFEEKIISAQEYDSAETRYKTALADYKNSMEEARSTVALAYSKDAQLGAAHKRLKDTTVQAPLAGSISKRSISAGEYVKAGTPLLTIVQDHPLKLRGMIAERYLPEIRAGQSVEVRVDAFPDRTFTGKLTRIAPSAEVSSRSFLVEGLVENSARLLKPGFFAKASILTHVDPAALTVPQQALATFAGITKVFVIENDVARERVVETGVRVGTNEVEIVRGVRPGELVAISGLTRLVSGMRVKVSGPVMPRRMAEGSDGPR
jgi:RND family efflux transporter MFP subunit